MNIKIHVPKYTNWNFETVPAHGGTNSRINFNLGVPKVQYIEFTRHELEKLKNYLSYLPE